ncbi:MAG: YfhO family protein, partial [Candidatus Sabulitectum sp.]|nr:YfhO family protein [Candidatus Sabulitectum sp.]
GAVIARRVALLSKDFLRAFTVTGLLAALVLLVRKGKGSAWFFAAVVLVISSFELIPFNRDFQVYLTSTTIESMFPDTPLLREITGEGRVFPGGNQLVPLGIRSVYGYHAAKPAATDRLMALVRTSSPWVLRQTAMTSYASAEGSIGWEQLRPALAEEIPGYPLDPMPRAFIPRSVVLGSVDHGFEAIESGIDPQIRSYIVDGPSSYDGVVGRAEILVDLPEHVTVQTETSGACYLVLADSWYPNWEVTVDGNPGTIYKANGWMRGVQVPAGEHTVEFSYSSRNVVHGGIISVAALLLILLSILLSTMKRKRLNA